MSPAAHTVGLYFGYLVISVGMTIWVAKTLHKNGRVFLVDAFRGNEALADSVNHLLVVGFYLVNLGFVSLALKEQTRPEEFAAVLEHLSAKVGFVLLVLGGMHFFNLAVFSKLRTHGRRPPPPTEEIGAPVGPMPTTTSGSFTPTKFAP